MSGAAVGATIGAAVGAGATVCEVMGATMGGGAGVAMVGGGGDAGSCGSSTTCPDLRLPAGAWLGLGAGEVATLTVGAAPPIGGELLLTAGAALGCDVALAVGAAGADIAGAGALLFGSGPGSLRGATNRSTTVTEASTARMARTPMPSLARVGRTADQGWGEATGGTAGSACSCAPRAPVSSGAVGPALSGVAGGSAPRGVVGGSAPRGVVGGSAPRDVVGGSLRSCGGAPQGGRSRCEGRSPFRFRRRPNTSYSPGA
jgi:hypothetical protein